jgi:hypothetical protein
MSSSTSPWTISISLRNLRFLSLKPSTSQGAVERRAINISGFSTNSPLTRVVCFFQVQLVGFSEAENERCLVYEYMINGTVQEHLWGRFSLTYPF